MFYPIMALEKGGPLLRVPKQRDLKKKVITLRVPPSWYYYKRIEKNILLRGGAGTAAAFALY